MNDDLDGMVVVGCEARTCRAELVLISPLVHSNQEP